MRAVYTLRVRPNVLVPVRPGTLGITFDGIDVDWCVNAQGDLEALLLGFPGVALRFSDSGTILSSCPETEDRAYAVAVYLSNRLFTQTLYDAIDPEQVFAGSPAVSPENEEEEELFRDRFTTVGVSFTSEWQVHGLFEPAVYAVGFDHAAAYGYYANALRAEDRFQRVELLYKVVEYFFSVQGRALDAAVSAHALPCDDTFTPAMVEGLRSVRNRCTHPQATRGHLGPHDRASYREVSNALALLRKLCDLLLEHPPAL